MHPLVASEDLATTFLLRYDRKGTRNTYGGALHAFFGPTITIEEAQAISFVDVNRYVEACEQRGLKPSTIRGHISILRTFYDWLIALRLVKRNPAARHVVRRIPRVDPMLRPVRALTGGEASRLVEATKTFGPSEARDRALLLTLLHCALRRGEAARMDFEHLRMVDGYSVLHLPEAKGGSDQWVRIPEHVAAAIGAVRSTYGYESGAVWRRLKGRKKGARLRGEDVYAVVRRAARRARLLGVTTHTLRHTACTLALEGGATLKQVQTHARHKNIATTLVYVHQRDLLADNAADYIRL